MTTPLPPAGCSRRHFLAGAAALTVAPSLLAGCNDAPSVSDPTAATSVAPSDPMLKGLPYESDPLWTGAVIPEVVTTGRDAPTIPEAIELIRLPASANFTAGGGQTLHPNENPNTAFKFDWRFPGPEANRGYANPRGWFVQFNVKDATQLEFLVFANGDGFEKPGPAWNLMVDGKRVWDYGRNTPVKLNAFNLVRFTLPDNAPHTIRFYMNALSLQSVFANPGATATAEPLRGPRVFFLGDSLTQGNSDTVATEAGSWIWRFGSMCGFDDIWNGGISSTGFVADPTDKSATYLTRATTDVTPANPQMVFVTSYYRDRNKSPKDIGPAVSETLDIILALPNTPKVIVTGSYDPWGANGSDFANLDTLIKSECFNRSIPYIEPSSGAVYDGAGNRVGQNLGPWVTEKNRKRVISKDNVHQSDFGMKYFAYRMYAAYRAIPQP